MFIDASRLRVALPPRELPKPKPLDCHSSHKMMRKHQHVTKGQAKNVEGFELKRDSKVEKPKVTFDDIIQHVVAKDPDVVIAQARGGNSHRPS